MSLSVLVVDDEADLLSEIVRHLRRHGYRVTAAASFVEGRDRICEAVKLDVLVTDLRMPDGDGLDLVQLARRRHGTCRIIVNTGHLDGDQAIAAEHAGADAVLFKPFGCRDLLALIRAAEPAPLATTAA